MPRPRVPLAALLALAAAATPTSLRAQDSPYALSLAAAQAADSTLQQAGSFSFDLGGRHYSVQANGAGVRAAADTAAFTLAVPNGGKIERIYWGPAGGDVLVLWETSDPDGGSTSVARLDGASLVARWTQHMPTLNTAPPLITGHEMYVAGLDFLGRLDPETGDFAWQKNMLSPRGARPFQAFGNIGLDGDRVAFTEDVRGRPGRTVRASRADGTVIEIAPAR